VLLFGLAWLAKQHNNWTVRDLGSRRRTARRKGRE
jgi:hypothetical protein